MAQCLAYVPGTYNFTPAQRAIYDGSLSAAGVKCLPQMRQTFAPATLRAAVTLTTLKTNRHRTDGDVSGTYILSQREGPR